LFAAMTRSIKLALTAFAAIALALPAGAVAQGSFTVDPALAKTGKKLWQNRGCSGCHGIGKKQAGPDLAGVSDRRDADWLRRWLKDTDSMLQTDSIAQAMLAEWNNIKMPNLKLSDADVDALLHYIAQETAKQK
jgi:protein SCO1/2